MKTHQLGWFFFRNLMKPDGWLEGIERVSQRINDNFFTLEIMFRFVAGGMEKIISSSERWAERPKKKVRMKQQRNLFIQILHFSG